VRFHPGRSRQFRGLGIPMANDKARSRLDQNAGSASQWQTTKPAADLTRMPRPSRGASLIGRKDWPISPRTRSTWRLIQRFRLSLRRFWRTGDASPPCSTRWWFKYGGTKPVAWGIGMFWRSRHRRCATMHADANTPARFLYYGTHGRRFFRVTAALCRLRYTSFTFLSGRLRTGLPVAA